MPAAANVSSTFLYKIETTTIISTYEKENFFHCGSNLGLISPLLNRHFHPFSGKKKVGKPDKRTTSKKKMFFFHFVKNNLHRISAECWPNWRQIFPFLLLWKSSSRERWRFLEPPKKIELFKLFFLPKDFLIGLHQSPIILEIWAKCPRLWGYWGKYINGSKLYLQSYVFGP